jgi:formamidopyrimidine-DNA glycosylase
VPELPEVETARRALAPLVVGRTIGRCLIDDVRLVAPARPAEVAAALEGERIAALDRRGKYLIFRLEAGGALAAHLRMTGMFRVVDGALPAFTRAVLALDDGRRIAYTDIRRFGTWQLFQDELGLAGFLAVRLGPEPMGEEFTASHLARVLAGRRAPLKSALLDQRVCAGMGSIYADEAMFRARLHPLRPAGSLGPRELARLAAAIRESLDVGLRFGGSTIRNYAAPDGTRGEAQEEHLCYGRAGEPCRRCGTTLRRAVAGGRSTTFCPRCQRLPRPRPGAGEGGAAPRRRREGGAPAGR